MVDDTSSSLGDSTYDFLDDKSGFTTDDEDAGNLTNSISSSDAHESDAPAIHQSQDTARPAQPPSNTDNIEQTEEVATEGDHEDPDYEHADIKLDEPSHLKLHPIRSVEGSHTLRIFDEHEVKEMVNVIGTQAPMSQLKATVKQTMAGRTLPLRGPFGMLYIGETGPKDTIIQKIGSALTASSGRNDSSLGNLESPRFNVVPISSFGETRPPEVLLVDSLGIEVKVDHCTSATSMRKDDGNDSISLRISNGASLTSMWSSHETKYIISTSCQNWELPQIAIFYLSDTESMAAKQTRRYARSFLSRHKVPCLVITQSQVWNRQLEAMTLDYLTPHLCLESCGSDTARPRIIKRLPIDLATFLNLDAIQINRNLACLAHARNLAEMKFRDISAQKGGLTGRGLIADETGCCSAGAAGNKYSLWSFTIPEQVRPFTKLPTLILMVLAMGITWQAMNFYRPLPHINVPSLEPAHIQNLGKPQSTFATKISGIQPTSIRSIQSVASISVPSSTSKAATQSNTDLASLLLDSYSLRPNNSAKFKVHVVGDRHIVLRPPQWFVRYRKAPKLVFNITRKDQTVKHDISVLFDGIYALKLPREEAFGLLDLSVRTNSKPKVDETFQVDFGKSWLRAASWRDTVRTVAVSIKADIETLQSGLTSISKFAGTEIYKVSQEVANTADVVHIMLDKIKSASLHWTAATTDALVAHTKALSRINSTVFGKKRANLTKTLSLRNRGLGTDLSQYAMKKTVAWTQAFRIWSGGAHSMSIKEIARGLGKVQQNRLRSTQKRLLKTWWKLAGLPRYASDHAATEATQGERPKRTGI